MIFVSWDRQLSRQHLPHLELSIRRPALQTQMVPAMDGALPIGTLEGTSGPDRLVTNEDAQRPAAGPTTHRLHPGFVTPKMGATVSHRPVALFVTGPRLPLLGRRWVISVPGTSAGRFGGRTDELEGTRCELEP
jgi:hypothetical protein